MKNFTTVLTLALALGMTAAASAESINRGANIANRSATVQNDRGYALTGEQVQRERPVYRKSHTRHYLGGRNTTR